MNYRYILLSMLISLSAKSQENQLSNEIDFVKSEALLQGFETIREDTLKHGNGMHFVLTSDIFEKGNAYYWVLFADNCSDCEVHLAYRRANSSANKALEAVTNRSENIQRLEYTFRKTDTLKFTLEAHVKGGEATSLYSILCKKTK